MQENHQEVIANQYEGGLCDYRKCLVTGDRPVREGVPVLEMGEQKGVPRSGIGGESQSAGSLDPARMFLGSELWAGGLPGEERRGKGRWGLGHSSGRSRGRAESHSDAATWVSVCCEAEQCRSCFVMPADC